MTQWFIIDPVLNFNQSTFYIKYTINRHMLTTYYFKFNILSECHYLHYYTHAYICISMSNLLFCI